MKIQMPKACISCTQYQPIAKKTDAEHSPFKPTYWNKETRNRVQYGHCEKHKKEVFCTEICAGFVQDDLVDVVEVINRPVPMNPHQELMEI